MRIRFLFVLPVFVLSFTCAVLLSCSKTGFITSQDASIQVTADTLKFDTVFTTIGSVTQSFKIINTNDRKLRLSSVRLMGGSSSNYKINIDGAAVTESTKLDLEPNDSLYIFVQVTVDPSSADLPFIIRDSISIAYNGNEKFVQLESWGQNAHFFRDKAISTNETWTNDLPYVIQGYLYIDQQASLTIEKGCRIYIHADAPVIVDGSLQVNGGKDTVDRVYFTGDRLDEPYKNFPASWPGIYFSALSANNLLQYAVIKNAYQGLIAEGEATGLNPKLILNECVIDNIFDAGILASNSNIIAQNCLISNCGKNISLTGGGQYQFTHCTIVSYSNTYITHKDPVLFISNSDVSGATAPLNALFRNCILWGEGGLIEDEVVAERAGTASFEVNFDHSLWKVNRTPSNVKASQMITGQPPLFDSIDVTKRYYDFRLKPESPAIDKGATTSVLIDLDGKSRPVNQPDPGCFERH